MAGETQARDEIPLTEEAPKLWQPSRRSVHHVASQVPPSEARVTEVDPAVGMVGAIARYLKRPFVRLLIGLGIFILGAIIYDETVNYGSWTERKDKARPTHTRGIPATPD